MGALKVGSLFSGIGGLEMGVCEAEPGAEVIWQAECDPFALKVLGTHWPKIRKYTDVKEIDGRAERPDVICGGFPCQPHSVAGKRRGTGDIRWMWPEFARIIGELRPEFVFIENVPGLRTSGLRDVLADLASLGFDAEWDLFSAAEAGAPHLRKRLFILAHATGKCEREPPDQTDAIPSCRPTWDEPWGGGQYVADSNGAGLEKREKQPTREEREAAERGGASLSNPDGSRELQCGRSICDIRGRASYIREQADPWAIEPDVGRVADGVAARSHRLRLLGNAAVPRQAKIAWEALKSRLPVPGTVGKEPISGSGMCGPGCQNEGKCFDE